MPEEPCIEWTGGRWDSGYGYRVRRVSEGPGKRMIAIHREVWEKANGPIPPGRLVMHTCDNPPCYNLAHLRLGTTKTNAEDMAAKRRDKNGRKTHCPNGHEYDTIVVHRSGPRAGKPTRRCSICRNARRRQTWAEKHVTPEPHVNARKTHCPSGHEYDTIVLVGGRPRRRCSICINARRRELRARR